MNTADFTEPTNEQLHRLVEANADRAGRRVSHDDLMAATHNLRAAYDKEMAAGERARAMEINQLILHIFMAAIRVEDIPALREGVPS